MTLLRMGPQKEETAAKERSVGTEGMRRLVEEGLREMAMEDFEEEFGGGMGRVRRGGWSRSSGWDRY